MSEDTIKKKLIVQLSTLSGLQVQRRKLETDEYNTCICQGKRKSHKSKPVSIYIIVEFSLELKASLTKGFQPGLHH